jgi:alpha,alpha-trehalose phosphorylase
VRDSSLSACTQAIVAAEVGHLGLAYEYLAEAALMDLHDLEHNAADGVHIASLAGGVLAAVAGLGGFRDHGGALSFKPRLPDGLTRLRFGLMIRGALLRVEVSPDRATYGLERGEALDLSHWGDAVRLQAGESAERAIPAAPKLERPAQPRGRAPARRRGG